MGEQPTNNEITEEIVSNLFKLMATDKYKELLKGSGRKIRAWEKVSKDIEALGYIIPGGSLREKSQELYRSWKKIKISFWKYQQNENTDCDMIKPPYYDLFMNTVPKKTNDVVDVSVKKSLNSSNCLDVIEHEDHDYGGTKNLREISETLTPSLVPSKQSNNLKTDVPTTQSIHPILENCNSTSSQSKTHEIVLPKHSSPSTNPVRSCDVLQQIKALNETALNVQQQNFSKIISLLEEQVSQQTTLNLLFSQYIKNQTNMNNHKANCNKSSNNL